MAKKEYQVARRVKDAMYLTTSSFTVTFADSNKLNTATGCANDGSNQSIVTTRVVKGLVLNVVEQ